MEKEISIFLYINFYICFDFYLTNFNMYSVHIYFDFISIWYFCDVDIFKVRSSNKCTVCSFLIWNLIKYKNLNVNNLKTKLIAYITSNIIILFNHYLIERKDKNIGWYFDSIFYQIFNVENLFQNLLSNPSNHYERQWVSLLIAVYLALPEFTGISVHWSLCLWRRVMDVAGWGTIHVMSATNVADFLVT